MNATGVNMIEVEKPDYRKEPGKPILSS